MWRNPLCRAGSRAKRGLGKLNCCCVYSNSFHPTGGNEKSLRFFPCARVLDSDARPFAANQQKKYLNEYRGRLSSNCPEIVRYAAGSRSSSGALTVLIPADQLIEL